MKIFLALLYFALSAGASTVTFNNTNHLGQADTNVFRIVPVDDVILANGGVIPTGPAIRCVPDNTGFFQTNLTVGNYQATNAEQNFIFRVYNNDALTYSVNNLAISGFNTFVTVYLATNNSAFGGATNAVSQISSNGVSIGSQVTNLNFWQGTNTTFNFTNHANGLVDISVSSTAAGSGVTNNQKLPGTSGATNFNSTILLAPAYYPGTNFWTNGIYQGGGGLVSVSNAFPGTPAIIVTNASLEDLWITNTTSLAGQITLGIVSTGLQPSNAYPIFIRHCRIQSRSIAFDMPFSMMAPGPPTVDIRDSIFEGLNEAFEIWGALTYIDGCKFTVPLGGDSYGTAMTMNDHSTNFVKSSVLETLGHTNANGNIGALLFQASWSEFDNCLFRVRSTTNGVGLDCAVHFSEDFVTGIFNDCFFQLSPFGEAITPLCLVDSAGTSGKLEFNNCFYWPQTNGVIVDNATASVVVAVRGGNLKRSNFTHPERVNWMDTVTTTNLDASKIINNGNTEIDLVQGIIYDTSAIESVDTGNRILADSSVVASVDWGNRELDDTSGNPTVDWLNRRLLGAWSSFSPFKSAGYTNTTLTAKTVIAADANKNQVSIANAIGFLNNDGSGNFAWSSVGNGGAATNAIAQVSSNDVAIVSPSTNLVFWVWQNLIFGLTNRNNGTADVGITGNLSQTNIASLTFSNLAKITAATGGNSNALEIVNKVGQTVAKFGTNGTAVFGTNNQEVIDPAGNVTISGQFNGLLSGGTGLPLSGISSIAGLSFIGNNTVSANTPTAVPVDLLPEGLGNTVGGVPIRGASGHWTNSAGSTATALLSSLNVTNILNANTVQASNTLYVGPGQIASSNVFQTDWTNGLAMQVNKTNGVATFYAGAQFNGGGPALSWSNILGAGGDNGVITTNAGIMQSNALDGTVFLFDGKALSLTNKTAAGAGSSMGTTGFTNVGGNFYGVGSGLWNVHVDGGNVSNTVNLAGSGVGLWNVHVDGANVSNTVNLAGSGVGLWNVHVDGGNVSNAVANATTASFVSGAYITNNTSATQLTNQITSTNDVLTTPFFAGNVIHTNGTYLMTNNTAAGKNWSLLSPDLWKMSNGVYQTEIDITSTNISIAGAAINAGLSFGSGNALSNSVFTQGGSNDTTIRAGYQTNNATWTNGNFYLLDAAFLRNTLGVLGALWTTNTLNVGTTLSVGGSTYHSNTVTITSGGAVIGGMSTITNGFQYPTNRPSAMGTTIVLDANTPVTYIRTNAAFAVAGIANLGGAGIVNRGIIVWTNSNNALLSSTFGGGWVINKVIGANTVSTWSVTNGTAIAEWWAMTGHFTNVTLSTPQ